jgi:hypothetical protein
MKRRDLFRAGLVTGGAFLYGRQRVSAAETVVNPLTPPASGTIPVAFLLSDGAVVIDFAGPWEVFRTLCSTTRGCRFIPIQSQPLPNRSTLLVACRLCRTSHLHASQLLQAFRKAVSEDHSEAWRSIRGGREFGVSRRADFRHGSRYACCRALLRP